MRYRYILLLLIMAPVLVMGFPQNRKKVTAIKIDTPLKLDGYLDEACYQKAEPATDFLQLQPYNGRPANKNSEVRLFYDDNALYVGAMLYENPDSIRSYVTTRDAIGASDYFLIALDPYNEGLIMYEFLVTPAGAQVDLKGVKREFDSEDIGWNAVWQSKTRITENGWIAEMRIPYSAIRFPNKKEHVWGLNFFRRLRRFNSNTSWQHVDHKINGFIQQSGELHGIKNINTPVRLSLTPYLAGYLQKNSQSEIKPLIKGGLDLKMGIGDGHTLDMMLVPDFGQIQSDDEELNLSPYEIHYDERRQFFTEGVELFNRADIFYSRRIGSSPKNSGIAHENLGENEKVTYNPNETQLINATKLSGRDKNGWGVGFLNAMSLASKAEITNQQNGSVREVITQPFTNFNVMVVEKSLKNNSLISLINTNMLLANTNRFANVTGTEFQLKNKQESYQLSGKGAYSYRSFDEIEKGYMYQLGLRKVKGSFRFEMRRELYTDTYNPNDMGFLMNNNEIKHQANANYNIFEPFSIFKRWEATLFYENNRLYKPNNKMGSEIGFWTDATFSNDWWYGMYVGHHFLKHDYFETRVQNRYWAQPGGVFSEFNLRTNQNLPLSFSGSIGLFQRSEKDMNGYWAHAGLWWKASPQLSLNYDISKNLHQNSKGHVYHSDANNIIFGNYTRKTWENSFDLNYAFNTKISTSLRMRHYWSKADYTQYYDLQSDGSLTVNNEWNENNDVNFNAFNIDASLKWEFAPGSELSLVWKNEIYRSNANIDCGFLQNFKETIGSNQLNSLSLKLLYYIDYNYFKR